MQCYFLQATTLSDAWFRLVYNLMKGDTPHHVYQIEKGSYVGSKRLEYDYVTVQIDRPFERPLIPEIPPHLNIPPPVESMEYVEDYFTNYLMNPTVGENETYRYSTWLAPGVERVIEQLKGAPGNNQAAISIGGIAPKVSIIQKGSIIENLREHVDTDNYIDPATDQRDPACLRVVDFRLDQENKLHMITYWRSWCLLNGLPANLAGLQLLSELVAQEIGAEPGKMVASSKGLHLYSHGIQVAAERIGMKDVATMEDFLNYVEENRDK